MSAPDYRVLVIDDDEDDFVLTRDVFSRIPTVRYKLGYESDFEAGLVALCSGSYDVALLDYQLGARTGLELLEEARRRDCKTPIIFLTGQGDHAVDVAAMRAGAADYLVKGDLRPDLLDRAVRYAVARARDQHSVALLNQRLMEEHSKLLRAERLSSIGLISAGVAHEINNPLCGIMALVKALLDRPLPASKSREYLLTIQDGLERMRGTVQGLLDFARERPLAMVAVDVADVVDECMRLAGSSSRQKQVTVRSRLHPKEAVVVADRSRLMQVLLNLLLNAIYATPAGGVIEFSASHGDSRVGICVSDTGAGIPQEIIERVCDPFFSTKPTGQGTGLGLAIASSIVKAHKGELSIKSHPGEGTSVTVWLPERSASSVVSHPPEA